MKINTIILHLLENGFIKYWTIKNGPKLLYQHHTDNNKPQALSVYQLVGAFLILGLGHIIALIILFIELFYRKKNLPPKRNIIFRYID